MSYLDTAQPRPGTVTNVNSDPCPAAWPEDYPLYATCRNCQRDVRCADGTAEWVHTNDYRAACS